MLASWRKRLCWWLACASQCVSLMASAGAAVADEEGVIHAGQYGQCFLQLEARQNSLIIRVPGACLLTNSDLATFLPAALAKLPPVSQYNSVFLGRVVDYPWISEQLVRVAQADPSVPGMTDAQRYPFVRAVLMQPVILAVFAEPLAQHGYRITGASVEKVLTALPGARPVPAWVPADSRLPFDALWHYTVTPVTH